MYFIYVIKIIHSLNAHDLSLKTSLFSPFFVPDLYSSEVTTFKTFVIKSLNLLCMFTSIFIKR